MSLPASNSPSPIPLDDSDPPSAAETKAGLLRAVLETVSRLEKTKVDVVTFDDVEEDKANRPELIDIADDDDDDSDNNKNEIAIEKEVTVRLESVPWVRVATKVMQDRQMPLTVCSNTICLYSTTNVKQS